MNTSHCLFLVGPAGRSSPVLCYLLFAISVHGKGVAVVQAANTSLHYFLTLGA